MANQRAFQKTFRFTLNNARRKNVSSLPWILHMQMLGIRFIRGLKWQCAFLSCKQEFKAAFYAVYFQVYSYRNDFNIILVVYNIAVPSP